MQSLSAILAILGINSETLRPGTLVAIGANGPRTSAGASGLGSKVECCAGPPFRKSTMHDLAFPNEPPWTADLARAVGKFKDAPNAPRPPIRRTSRRVMPSHGREFDP